MMSKLSTQGGNQNRPFKPCYIKEKGKTKIGIIIIIEIDDRIAIDEVVMIGKEDQIIEVDLSIDKIINKVSICSEL